MKISELHQKSKYELKRLLDESREQLRKLNFDIQLKKFKKVRDIRKMKKLIAQVLTIIHEKDINN